jgi:hypothetical protein
MSAGSAVVAHDDRSSQRAPVVRRLVVTWQHPDSRKIQPVGVLAFDGEIYSFRYISNVMHVEGFRPLLGFPDLGIGYESEVLFPLFSQRVMGPRRPDYSRFVSRLGLETDASPWEQIARSSGRRQGDTLQLFPEPTIDQNGVLRCTFLVHGVRHVPDRSLRLDGAEHVVSQSQVDDHLAALRPGDALRIFDESDNPVDPRALVIATDDGFPLGWLPDLLLEEIHSARERTTIKVTVEHVNGPDVIWHMRLLASLSAEMPVGHVPFSGPSWEPYAGSNSGL